MWTWVITYQLFVDETTTLDGLPRLTAIPIIGDLPNF